MASSTVLFLCSLRQHLEHLSTVQARVPVSPAKNKPVLCKLVVALQLLRGKQDYGWPESAGMIPGAIISYSYPCMTVRPQFSSRCGETSTVGKAKPNPDSEEG